MIKILPPALCPVRQDDPRPPLHWASNWVWQLRLALWRRRQPVSGMSANSSSKRLSVFWYILPSHNMQYRAVPTVLAYPQWCMDARLSAFNPLFLTVLASIAITAENRCLGLSRVWFSRPRVCPLASSASTSSMLPEAAYSAVIDLPGPSVWKPCSK